ncbi:hypothetical protein GF319_05510 [Candidatus Bathyarchaeota archaeon]|nr:hypothetical protein [Candidatus Bathyarchaeota archaeon]
MTRDIKDILYFRQDISPFLVHLTRDDDEQFSPEEKLEKILDTYQLIPGGGLVSDVRYGRRTTDISQQDLKRYFGAICFTETPLNEVHCLLDISYRNINLSPYGLVFLKDRLIEKGVGPVLYINNVNADMDDVFTALSTLLESHPNEAKKILPMFSVFGQKIHPPGADGRPSGLVDFRWEREWRYPSAYGNLDFTAKDVFIGLCPHEKISYFDSLFNGIDFIDPCRNMKWYATKLIAARQRLDLKYSVV